MVPLAGAETGAVEIVGKAQWWKKHEHYGPAGEVSKSMPGKCLYVSTGESLFLRSRLIKIPAFGRSCPWADLDERRDVIEAHMANLGPACGKVGICINNGVGKVFICRAAWLLISLSTYIFSYRESGGA